MDETATEISCLRRARPVRAAAHPARLFALAWLFALVPMAARADAGLFGSRESISANLKPFAKWTGMLERDPPHREKMRANCAGNGDRRCDYARWMRLAEQAKALPFPAMLALVNRELNRVPYVLDQASWGVEDYWETPYEFFLRDGDCEDYAIGKYMTLKLAGVPAADMRIVVLQDTNLNLLHSVLAVRHDGQNYILDNQTGQVVGDSAIHHYQPIYSINEEHWWRHMPR